MSNPDPMFGVPFGARGFIEKILRNARGRGIESFSREKEIQYRVRIHTLKSKIGAPDSTCNVCFVISSDYRFSVARLLELKEAFPDAQAIVLTSKWSKFTDEAENAESWNGLKLLTLSRFACLMNTGLPDGNFRGFY